jgi:hypothetical protein
MGRPALIIQATARATRHRALIKVPIRIRRWNGPGVRPARCPARRNEAPECFATTDRVATRSGAARGMPGAPATITRRVREQCAGIFSSIHLLHIAIRVALPDRGRTAQNWPPYRQIPSLRRSGPDPRPRSNRQASLFMRFRNARSNDPGLPLDRLDLDGGPAGRIVTLRGCPGGDACRHRKAERQAAPVGIGRGTTLAATRSTMRLATLRLPTEGVEATAIYLLARRQRSYFKLLTKVVD